MPTSSPDLDPRYEALVRELRGGAVVAPDPLRARIDAFGEPAAGRSRRPYGWVALVAAALLVVAGLALVARPQGSKRVERDEGAASGGRAGVVHGAAATTVPLTIQSGQARVPDRPAALAPSPARLQRYGVSMRLRVRDGEALSRATARALRIARGLGGYVVSVDYADGAAGPGQAFVTMRVPTTRVQDAIVRFSGLGTILAQRIAIRDVQAGVNRTDERIAVLERRIASLREPVALAQAKAELARLQARRAVTVRGARLATVSLALTTRQAAEPVEHEGRVTSAWGDALSLLGRVAAGAVYALVLGLPLAALLGLALWLSRRLRRRSTERLLRRA